MADAQVGNEVGVAARGGNNLNGGAATNAGLFLTNANDQTIALLRTRLAAISASYTADRLNTMSYNDMVYAVRLADHAASI